MKNKNVSKQLKKATINLALWSLLWLMSLALATFGPKFIWQQDTTWSIIAIAINMTIGSGLILAHIKHLAALDELQKKIQLDAMAVALGVGIVGGLSYSVMDIANVISGDAEIAFLVMLIGITYIIAIVIGKKRYI
ncbi:hypothetical protein [Constantimarinum furrinae]|uniref:Uncharacterized protein n=1 Tax=Constantimarinum furrinae TaxID=2562285 RepID=A0A7G8PTH5_9FLAO|nr:hypothetical protein [Constantimarinum furrinae]QNJ97641.1 hypothetical protein ALE3EI_1068 [Constantimarinum furrinae]